MNMSLTKEQREFLRDDIQKELENKCTDTCFHHQRYCIDNFQLDNLTINIEISRYHTYVRKLKIWLKGLPRIDSEGDLVSYVLLEKEFNDKEYDKLVDFICELRDMYVYSKILDKISKVDDIEYQEEKKLIHYKLCKGKEMGECCVCSDITVHMTSCNHTLCRECYCKLEYIVDDDNGDYIPCPMCRSPI